MIQSAFACAVSCLFWVTAFAADEPPTAAEIQAFMAEVLARSEASIEEGPEMVRVNFEDGSYFFTKEDHYAHPAYAVRKPTRIGQTHYMKTTIRGASDPTALRRWASEFSLMDEKLRERIEQRRRNDR
jgi:hypothetical protein